MKLKAVKGHIDQKCRVCITFHFLKVLFCCQLAYTGLLNTILMLLFINFTNFFPYIHTCRFDVFAYYYLSDSLIASLSLSLIAKWAQCNLLYRLMGKMK